MPLTIVVRVAEGGEQQRPRERLAIVVDSPRIVIGRGESADVSLPDPSVSHRHATLRSRGAETLLQDEGSTNGTFLGRVRLSPHSPRVIKSGELVRVGRVWLEIQCELAAVPDPAEPKRRGLALELVTRALESQGEACRPEIRVVAGEDTGKSLRIDEPGRPYVIGRASSADLPLEDADVSRRHVEVSLSGADVHVRDLGAKVPALLDESALKSTTNVWRPGQPLALAATRLELRHPAAAALAELEGTADEKMAADEEIPPPAARPREDASSASGSAGAGGNDGEPGGGLVADSADAEREQADAQRLGRGAEGEPVGARRLGRQGERETAPGWSFADAAVLLLALGVLALSGLGLFWLLGR